MSDPKCSRGRRCRRCLKLSYKLRIAEYQKKRRSMFEDSDKDNMGNLIVHPTMINQLMRSRMKIGRAYRLWKRSKNG